MRKVFLSNMFLQKIKPAKYISNDFELGDAQFKFPLTYIINNEAADGDEIVVVTATIPEAEAEQVVKENGKIYKNEIREALKNRKVDLKFIDIDVENDYDAITVNRFFKKVADTIHDNDKVYSDITFGIKPYTFSMFIAIAYAVKAAVNVELETVIYSKMYDGRKKPELADTSEICDMTSLFYLNSIAGKAQEGQKDELNTLLDFIIDAD